jgi:hypothetical protein
MIYCTGMSLKLRPKIKAMIPRASIYGLCVCPLLPLQFLCSPYLNPAFALSNCLFTSLKIDAFSADFHCSIERSGLISLALPRVVCTEVPESDIRCCGTCTKLVRRASQPLHVMQQIVEKDLQLSLHHTQHHLLSLALPRHRPLLAVLSHILFLALDRFDFLALDLASLLDCLGQVTMPFDASNLWHVCISSDESLIIL